MVVGSTMDGWILLMTVLSRWFVRRWATAIGMAQMFGPLGTIFLVPLVAVTEDPNVHGVGWRLVDIVVGGLIMAVAVFAFARPRNRPEDIGLLPDGGPLAVWRGSLLPSQALRTRSFLADRLRRRFGRSVRPEFDRDRTYVGALNIYLGLRRLPAVPAGD